MLRLASLLVLISTPAFADCPTSIEDLPAAGYVASVTRALTDPDAPKDPTFTAEIGATGGVRAENEEAIGIGNVGGKVTAQRAGFAGCASGDVITARETSAHVTGSASIPLFFTALSLGVAVDRQVELPLSTKPRFFLAPVDRIAGQFSIGFIDLRMADPSDTKNKLRVTVAPFTLEEARETQFVGEMVYERKTTTIDTALMRFTATDDIGAAKLDLFAFKSDWIDSNSGFYRVSFVAVEHERYWKIIADGGALGLAGAELDCEQVTCTRGFYRLGLGYNWERFSIDGLGERNGFYDVNGTPTLDDRFSATAALTLPTRRAALTAFGAFTRPWEGGDVGRTGGARIVASQDLGAGFLAVVDAEVARTYYGVREGAMLPAIEPTARLMLSLGWHASGSR